MSRHLARYFLRHCAHFEDVSDDIFNDIFDDIFDDTSVFVMMERVGRGYVVRLLAHACTFANACAFSYSFAIATSAFAAICSCHLCTRVCAFTTCTVDYTNRMLALHVASTRAFFMRLLHALFT